MALWSRLQSLEDDARTKLHEIYGKSTFPLEVRGTFAEWIEAQPWNSLEQGNPEHQLQAECLVQKLIEMLEEKSQSVSDLVAQINYVKCKTLIKEVYMNNPWYLVESVNEILTAERELIIKVENQATSFSPLMDIEAPESPAIPDVNKYIEDLKNILQKTDVALKKYKQQQEDFVIRYQEICKVDAEISQISQLPEQQKQENMAKLLKRKSDIENMLKERALQILGDREEIFKQLENLSSRIEHVSRRVYEELFLWRMKQQKSLSGGEKPESLDELQHWFESLTDTLWTLYQLCTQFKLLFDALPIIRSGNEKDKTEQILEKAVSSLTTLIQRSFIVDKQPPQVLKTQTKFQASVRLLVGTKLNLQMNCPEVTTAILSEKQAKELCEGKTIEETGNCGEILNNRGVMEYNQQLRALHADFKNLSLKKIKRQDRKGQESVLEAKSCLLFSAAITIGGERLPVMCMSVPVVVVVHGNQGPNSEATIFWDNFFSNPDREPFAVPDEVSWEEMSFALNARWAMTAECDLTEEHLMYLGAKLFQNCEKVPMEHSNLVSWHAFNKEPLKNRNFTFWEWFHSGMDVVKKHLRDHWNDGYLEFMSREGASNKLHGEPPGTFIIRFSDGEIGGVSIAWVQGKDGGGTEVLHLQPWTTKDFNIRSLADRIFDLDDLKMVYPGQDKEAAFGKFRSQDYFSGAQDPSGYVMSGIIAKINRGQEQGSSMSRMDTPPFSDVDLGADGLIHRFDRQSFTSEMPLNDPLIDPSMAWIDEAIEGIMDNGENITPSIEEFMSKLERNS